MAKITIYVPDQKPLKVSFDEQSEITVGRAADNDLVVNHESISSHHAKLQLEGDAYTLIDLNSTNGTKIDGIATSNGPLINGTRVSFGKVDAVYECAEAAPEETTSSEASAENHAFASNMEVEIAETSTRPADFTNLSPLEKAIEKNQLGKVAMLAGLIAIIATLATFGAAASMKVG